MTSYTSSGDQFDLGLLFTFPGYNYTFTNKYGGTIEETVSDIEPQVWTKYMFNPQEKFSFEVGLRADLQGAFQWLSGTPGGYAPEPRLTFSYKPADAVALYGKLWNVSSAHHGSE